MEHNCHSYALIMRPGAVLLLPTEHGYSPYTAIFERHFWQDTAPIQQAIRRDTGIRTAALRCLAIENFPDKHHLVYALEWLEGTPPAGAIWCSHDSLPALDCPFSTEQIIQWMDNAPHQPEWVNLGWYQQMVSRLPAALPEYQITAPPEQLRAWERSIIFRVPTNQGDLYLKPVPPMFAHEPALTRWLSDHYPDHSARVVTDTPYLITRDYGGTPLSKITDLATWEQAITRYARLQIEWRQHTDTLIQLGVPVRDIAWMAAHFETLLNDETALRCGIYPLSDEQITTLQGMIPRIRAACDALQPFPMGLEHGDLWSGQIIVNGAAIIFTDWSDSAITCPLFSLPFFLAEIPNELPNEPTAVERLRDAYLAVWKEHFDVALYPQVALLSPLYTALRYYLDLLPQMEQRWEMENMLTYNLRLLLKAA